MALKLYSSDIIFVDVNDTVAGDVNGTMSNGFGGSDLIFGPSTEDPFTGVYGYHVFGDAVAMDGTARGGNDVVIAGDCVFDPNYPFNLLRPEYYSAVPLYQFDIVGGAHVAGDADTMAGNSMGGNDIIIGGWGSMDVFFGDAASTMSGSSRGGNDTLAAAPDQSHTQGDVTNNAMAGDARTLQDDAIGGNDALVGGSANAFENETPWWWLYSEVTNVMLGDAVTIEGNATAGSDTLTGGWATAVNTTRFTYAYASNWMAGDAAEVVSGHLGDDVIVGGDAVFDTPGQWQNFARTDNFAAGDAFTFALHQGAGDPGAPVLFGNDQMTGGNNSGGAVTNIFYGDVGSDFSYGHYVSVPGFGGHDIATTASSTIYYGADTLTGGQRAINVLVGDADRMYANEVGGNDTITGGVDATDWLFGDAREMYHGAQGGNDLITGADASGHVQVTIENNHPTARLVGDAYWMGSGAVGGNDTLVSGTGNEVMWGDAIQMVQGAVGGHDTFVFLAANGHDQIMDFRPGEDRIDLSALGYMSLDDLLAAGRVEDFGNGTMLLLGADDPWSDTVAVVGVHDLADSDFVFAAPV